MTPVESFVHRQNFKLLKEQLEAPTNEAQRKMLLRLLADEEVEAETSGIRTADFGDARLVR
jgi:hypothetical protein